MDLIVVLNYLHKREMLTSASGILVKEVNIVDIALEIV